jgi:hypothetical protein
VVTVDIVARSDQGGFDFTDPHKTSDAKNESEVDSGWPLQNGSGLSFSDDLFVLPRSGPRVARIRIQATRMPALVKLRIAPPHLQNLPSMLRKFFQSRASGLEGNGKP